MILAPEGKLGPYEILESIGSGGMRGVESKVLLQWKKRWQRILCLWFRI